MEKLEGKRILVTGATGKVGVPMCERLIKAGNEVWGISRLTDRHRKQRLDDAGVHTRRVELVEPDFSQLPEYFDHIIHLGGEVCKGGENGVYMPSGEGFTVANQVNGEGTGRLMSRFRSAKSCLVVSSTGIYEQRPAENFDQVEDEDGRFGAFHAAAPQYSASKNAQEVVARFCAREFDLPTTIARMGCQLSSIDAGLASGYIGLVAGGLPFPGYHADRPSLWQYIHDDDLFGHLPGLLAIASTTPETLNWTGHEFVDIRDVARYIAKRLGKPEPEFIQDPWGLMTTLTDTSKLVEMVGPCQLDWKESFDRVIDDIMPEYPRLQ